MKRNDLVEMFEEMGYTSDWDFSKYDGLHWYEFSDPDTKRMVLQVEFGISKDKFLNEWFNEEDEYPPFFIAADTELGDFKLLKEKIDEKYGH